MRPTPPVDPPARHVLAVGSGKGGVGKSTVALNLALALAEQGARVGLLDLDMSGPDIPRMLDMKRTTTQASWTLASVKGNSIEPIELHGLRIMSTGFIIGEGDPFTMPAVMAQRMLWQLIHETRWGELDHLIIDLPPGTADVQQHLLASLALSGALIVVTPQDVAHLDARKAVSMYRRAGVEVVGGVENMSGLRCPHCEEMIEVLPRVAPERSIWADGVRCLATIPLEPLIGQAGDAGEPLLVREPGSASADVFRTLANEVIGRLEPRG